MITIAITISHGHHLRHLLIPPLMKTCFSSKIGKSTTAQPKIRLCLSFFGMTGSGDLLKFRFSKSSYSLSSKMGQDGQEKSVTTRGKTGFILLFSSLLQEKTLFATICICICVTPLARKKGNLYFNLDVNWCVGWGWGKLPRRTRKRDKIIDFKDNIVIIV